MVVILVPNWRQLDMLIALAVNAVSTRWRLATLGSRWILGLQNAKFDVLPTNPGWFAAASRLEPGFLPSGPTPNLPIVLMQDACAQPIGICCDLPLSGSLHV